LSPRRFCNAYLTWARERMSEPDWMRFESWLYETPVKAGEPSPADVAEGQAFLAFMAAAQSAPPTGGAA